MSHARWLRRLRRFVPYPLIGAALLWLPPMRPRDSALADQLLDVCGLLVALVGEALRFWTWGANAEAGLFTLRASGPYALFRHPLYVGNFLIVCGMLLIYNNPVMYLLVISSFVVLYNVIARGEEQQLLLPSAKLSEVYGAYKQAHPNRFLPQLGRWRLALAPAHPFAWSVAFKKEYESILGILFGWIALDLYEQQVVWRSGAGSALFYFELGLLAVLVVVAAVLYLHKKRTRVRWLRQPSKR